MACENRQLQIIKGVPHAVGDTASSEQNLEVISLMGDQNSPGFVLSDWTPGIAGIKGGGTWAASAVSPGRTLVAAEDDNVIETMTLTARADTQVLLAMRLRTLYRFGQNAKAFWENARQIEPVYIKWWAKDAPRAQYALIYTMTVAVDYPDLAETPTADVTLVIEREPYWRGLPPGQNPKVWTWDVIRGVKYDASNLLMYTSGVSVSADALANHAVGGTTVPNNDRSPNNNYLEIAAANVPGDAPALLQLNCNLSLAVSPEDYYIAVRSAPFDYDNTGTTFITTLDASAATLGTDAAAAADATCASGNRVNITPGTATDSLRLTFGLATPEYTGRFAVFLRAYQNAGAAGDWLAHIEVNAAPAFLSAGTPVIELPEREFTVGATHWPPVYMGEIQLPVGMDGGGVSNDGMGLTGAFFSLLVYARRIAGAGTLRFADLVLMPIDEGFVKISSAFDTTKGTDVVLDNTGYLSHGRPGDYAAPLIVTVQTGLSEMTGQSLMLTPGRINRIYFMRNLADATAGSPTATFPVRGNIVPRWRGIIDV